MKWDDDKKIEHRIRKANAPHYFQNRPRFSMVSRIREKEDRFFTDIVW